jgi:hypothetical protein
MKVEFPPCKKEWLACVIIMTSRDHNLIYETGSTPRKWFWHYNRGALGLAAYISQLAKK